jgi:hypothetical protein
VAMMNRRTLVRRTRIGDRTNERRPRRPARSRASVARAPPLMGGDGADSRAGRVCGHDHHSKLDRLGRPSAAQNTDRVARCGQHWRSAPQRRRVARGGSRRRSDRRWSATPTSHARPAMRAPRCSRSGSCGFSGPAPPLRSRSGIGHASATPRSFSTGRRTAGRPSRSCRAARCRSPDARARRGRQSLGP